MAELSIKRSSFSDFWSVYHLNIQRSDKSDSKIRLCQNSLSWRRLAANDKVIADCLHLVDWGGTDLLVKTASTLSLNLPSTSSSRQQMQAPEPRLPSSHAALTHSLGVHEDEGSEVIFWITCSPERWCSLCAAPMEDSEQRIICSPGCLNRQCAAPNIWHQSHCCSCCGEPPPLWQVWMHPVSLSSPAGNPGYSSLTCTANRQHREEILKTT